MKINHKQIDFLKRKTIELNIFPVEMDINTTWSLAKQKSGSDEAMLAQRKFMLSLSWLMVKIYEVFNESTSYTANYQQNAVTSAKELIVKNLKYGISTGRLARMTGYSQFHFARLFKKHTGMTVHEYIDVCRQSEMVKLQQEKLSSKEISELLGFASSAAFYNWLSKKKRKG